jgi:ABC-type sugar transport system ATPase subunit
VAKISLEGVSKAFGSVVAVRQVSLEIEDGEFMVLVGPSGSGKTTALRLVAGLESITAGHVRIGREIVDRMPPRDRDIAMVFQDYALYPQMTVYDNMAFGLRMRKVPRPEIERRVQRAAETLGIEGLLRRKSSQLSGGQRQRVALGRALVREPKAFLMDEPLSNLDAKLRAIMRAEIRALQDVVGTTTLYVTHDQVEAMTMGDRIAVMNDGNLEQVGHPDALYEDPVNVFVAGFVGSPAMSFGTFEAAQNGSTLVLQRDGIRLGFEKPAQELPRELILGIRPEHACLWREDLPLVGPMAGRVEFLEALGRETFVGVRVSDSFSVVVLAEGGTRFALGELVEVGLRKGQLYVFDPNTLMTVGRT